MQETLVQETLSQATLSRPKTRRVFTRYVKLLEPEAEPPTGKLWRELWQELRQALRRELRLRSLWSSPPSYLGLVGWSDWSTPEGEGTKDALEELACECYTYVFLRRLRALKAQLIAQQKKRNEADLDIDGLIVLNIRHFLFERQKWFDRLGFHLFEILQSAILEAVARQELQVLEGDERIRNATVLGFSRGPVPVPEEAASDVVRETVGDWIEELMPDLVTARGRRRDEVVETLRRRLPRLRKAGVHRFSFKQLVDPFKADVRARWQALFEQLDGELAVDAENPMPVRVSPDPGHVAFEDRYDFEKLCNCVSRALQGRQDDETTRLYLGRLWQLFRVQASAPGIPKPLTDLKAQKLLGIPRKRVAALKEVLDEVLRQCRATLSPAAFAFENRERKS